MEQMALWRTNFTGELGLELDNEPPIFCVRPHTLFIGCTDDINLQFTEPVAYIYPLQLFLRSKDIFKMDNKYDFLFTFDVPSLTLVVPDVLAFTRRNKNIKIRNGENGKAIVEVSVI